MTYLTSLRTVLSTIVIHHWESGHTSLNKHRKCIVHRGRLRDSRHVCESSYSCIFNLHLQEAWLGHWGSLKTKRKSDGYTFINTLNCKIMSSNKTKCIGLTNIWRNLRILLWVIMWRTFPDSGSMTGSLWILCFSKE